MKDIKEAIKDYQDEIAYDAFMAQPAWSGHMWAYEYCEEYMNTCLGFMRVFVPEKYAEVSDKLKTINQKLEELNHTEGLVANEVDAVDKQWWDLFEEVVDCFNGISEQLKNTKAA